MIVVGYDGKDSADPYWIVLNSRGTSNGQRPHGTFRLSTNMSIDATSGGSFAVPSTGWLTLSARFVDLPAPGVKAVPPSTLPPRDTDGDGLYGDANGNGRLDLADVAHLYSAIRWCASKEPVSAFDFNHNGRVDFADVVVLYGMCLARGHKLIGGRGQPYSLFCTAEVV